MNYCDLRLYDTANGPGIRVSLFVSGCTLHCKGCFNSESWDFKAGNKFTSEVEDRIIEALKDPFINGLSVLGGDPLEEANIEAVTRLCERVKTEVPNKDIWLWTGRHYEKYKHLKLMGFLDTIVDGPFVEKYKVKTQGQYRGSTNQRVIFLRH